MIRILLLLSFAARLVAQNDLRIMAADGSKFLLTVDGKAINTAPEAEVIARGVKDTVHVSARLEGSTVTSTLALLDHRKKTTGREFTYRLSKKNGAWQFAFTGTSDRIKLPDPLVPPRPKRDTAAALRNATLGTLCRMKDGRPFFLNNIPADGKCMAPMPEADTVYIKLLMKQASRDEDRVRLSEQILLNNCVSTRQLSSLLRYSPFEIDKLKLLRLGYFHLTDPSNAGSLKSDFRFESSKREFDYFMSHPAEYKPAGVTNCSVSVSEARVTILRDQLTAFPNDPPRLDGLKKLAPEMCFSVNQVKALLMTFTHDRERLSAAMALYPQCTEKAAYSRISEVFSDRNAGGQLEEFIRSQAR